MKRRVLLLAVAIAAILPLAGCAAKSPEDAYIDRIHQDSRITTESSDEEWIGLGEALCEFKAAFDDDEIDGMLGGLGGVGGLPESVDEEVLAVKEIAFAELCPE